MRRALGTCSPHRFMIYIVATIYSPHFKYTQSTEYTSYRELVCFAWKNNTSSSIHLHVSAICSSKSVQTVLDFTARVLQNLGCYRNNCMIRARSSTTLPDGIPGPSHIPKRKSPVGLYRGSEGAKGLVPPTQFVWKFLFRESLTARPQCAGAPSCWKTAFGWRCAVCGIAENWSISR
jgi:hypothetical protein